VERWIPVEVMVGSLVVGGKDCGGAGWGMLLLLLLEKKKRRKERKGRRERMERKRTAAL